MQFLFVSDNGKELFYFTESQNIIQYNQVNIDKMCELKPNRSQFEFDLFEMP